MNPEPESGEKVAGCRPDSLHFGCEARSPALAGIFGLRLTSSGGEARIAGAVAGISDRSRVQGFKGLGCSVSAVQGFRVWGFKGFRV